MSAISTAVTANIAMRLILALNMRKQIRHVIIIFTNAVNALKVRSHMKYKIIVTVPDGHTCNDCRFICSDIDGYRCGLWGVHLHDDGNQSMLNGRKVFKYILCSFNPDVTEAAHD